MNWSKTKNILIFALIVTNLFLIYVNFFSLNFETRRDNKALELLLLNDNIVYNFAEESLPTQINKIYVKYKTYSNDILKRILGGNYQKNNELLISDEYLLEIKDKNVLKLTRREIIESKNNSSILKNQIALKKFLKDSSLYDKTMTLEKTETHRNYSLFIYKKKYNNNFIEDSYIIAKVSNEKVYSLEMKWLEITEVSDQSNRLISFDNALYQLSIKSNFKKQSKIETVELGYILEKDILIKDIQSGEAFPYYKFVFDNGQEIYIEGIQK